MCVLYNRIQVFMMHDTQIENPSPVLTSLAPEMLHHRIPLISFVISNENEKEIFILPQQITDDFSDDGDALQQTDGSEKKKISLAGEKVAEDSIIQDPRLEKKRRFNDIDMPSAVFLNN